MPNDEAEGGLGKSEEEAEIFETPNGDFDWLWRNMHATDVQGGHIREKKANVKRDYDCGCPAGSAEEAGNCIVTDRRTCRTHHALCCVCGFGTCQRHRVIVNGLPVCSNCYRINSDPTWILLLTIALLGVIFLLSLKYGR